ncbi:MAG: hypothetical protein RJR34_00065 [Candidatus Methanoculleus thermohydrogenotrophicum]|nr:hypothetical protein [Candidatus Methanoculleus thermohydrogenotrophicum]
MAHAGGGRCGVALFGGYQEGSPVEVTSRDHRRPGRRDAKAPMFKIEQHPERAAPQPPARSSTGTGRVILTWRSFNACSNSPGRETSSPRCEPGDDRTASGWFDADHLKQAAKAIGPWTQKGHIARIYEAGTESRRPWCSSRRSNLIETRFGTERGDDGRRVTLSGGGGSPGGYRR